jgi:hypothetical protein
MGKVTTKDLNEFVNNNIDDFHKNKLKTLRGINLNNILQKKNPYLFKAKNLNSAHDLINDILSAFLYSSEEKLFGDFLEDLALFIADKTNGGWKSSAEGIDIEFKKDNVHYLVSVKSGTNWGNSSQQNKQEENFQKALKVIKQSKIAPQVQPVLGICYGKTKTSYLRGYMKVVGQSFWHLISDNNNLYTEIVEPLGYKAKEHNEEFLKEKNRILNMFTQEFIEKFCDNGNINWERLVQFNSGNLPIPE